MFYTLLELIKKIALFMIAGELLLHFAPHNYTKYMKPVMGIMILVKIITGVYLVSDRNPEEEMKEYLQQYEKKLEQMELSMSLDMEEQILHEKEEKLNYNIINDKNEEETKEKSENESYHTDIGNITVSVIIE